MRIVIVIAIVLVLAGCSKRDIPTSAPRPVVTAWIGVTGASMLPTFPTSALVETQFGVPYDQLAKGDTVLSWDYTATPARILHHRLVARQGDWWITQGDNPATNPTADRPFLTRDNYIARTTGRHVQLLTAPQL